MQSNSYEIALITGLKDVLNPQTVDVKVWDWAWGLHHTPRWSGATPVFWSVLSHIGLVLQLAKRELGADLNPIDTIGIMLHDSSEGLGFSDLPTPIKHSPEFAFYRAAEDRLMETIYNRFGLTTGSFNWELIKRYDHQALYVEWFTFFDRFRGHRKEIRPIYPMDISKLGPLAVAKPMDYVDHLKHLTINLSQSTPIHDINDLFMMPDILLPYVRPVADPIDEPIIDADILGQGV